MISMTPKLSPAHLTCLEQIRIANGWHEQKLITSENEFSDNDGTEADNLSRGDAFENEDGGIITTMEEEDIEDEGGRGAAIAGVVGLEPPFRLNVEEEEGEEEEEEEGGVEEIEEEEEEEKEGNDDRNATQDERITVDEELSLLGIAE